MLCLVAAVGAGMLDALVHNVNVHLQVLLGHVGLRTVLAGVPNIFVPSSGAANFVKARAKLKFKKNITRNLKLNLDL